MAVNYGGTLNVLNACRKYGVGKLIMSTSPSTRFDGNDIDGLKEDELTIPKKFLQLYAESKAMGETAVLKACSDSLLTVAIAPHQIYGPRDNLFLPGILEPMGNGQLRIFGNGKNKVSFTYIDNYCHGLILGFDSLYKGSPALGKFYIVTDGGWQQFFWGVVNSAGVAMGFKDLNTKVHLPALMMLAVGYICNVIGWVLGRKLRVSPFTVKMLTIHRWFDISAAERDLGYKPIVKFEEGFPKTLEWLKEDWLPKYKAKKARK
ncbi:unnamed protein product [Sphacelaria rigidula]